MVPEPARDQRLAEAAIAAGEIEHLVAGFEVRPERHDQIGAMREVRRDIGIGALRPIGRLARVLAALVRHSASKRSGCLRTNRAIPRACQSVCRERKRWSITAAYACVTTASGTYHRSHPACAAR